LNQLIASCRNAMYAAKSIKDAIPDIEQLKKSSKDEKYNFYLQARERIAGFYDQVIQLVKMEKPGQYFNKVTSLYKIVHEGYTHTLKELYKEGFTQKLNETELSTLLNFNRTLYTSQKSIVFALKDFLLHEKESAYFDELPGFIR
ncbi:MAG: hypothetical protein ABUT20_27660, partial [Bacteroidota bacterium]